MVFFADYDTYTRIAETTGTIQNGDTIFDLELKITDLSTSETGTFTLNPLDTQAFTDKEISVRCLEQGGKIPVRVVPFVILV